jgi:leader peptidase (prepilin peptidase)/N-methyltransferase
MGFGAGLIATVGWLGTRAFGREAMGFGDVKLMAMIGGLTGWQGILGTMFVACITGTVGGMLGKVLSGHPTATGKDLNEASPLSYLALRAFGAPREAKDEEPLALRPGGTLAARLATGDVHMPFGPYLSLGALLVMMWPEWLWSVAAGWSTIVTEHGTTISLGLMPCLVILLFAMVAAARRGGDEPEAD